MKDVIMMVLVVYTIISGIIIVTHPSPNDSYRSGQELVYNEAVSHGYGTYEVTRKGKIEFTWVSQKEKYFKEGRDTVYDYLIQRGLGKYEMDQYGVIKFVWKDDRR